MPDASTEQDAQLDQFIKSGQNEAAVKLLCQLALECAEKKDFEHAEAFRDQIYEVDSKALDEIMNVNNIIEKEKSKNFKADHHQQWAQFFNELSPEEADAFFLALKETSLDEDKTVLRQGSLNDRLYLVNQGKLKITHERNDKQMLIDTLSPGDIFGEDTFFSVNICTVTIKTLSKVNLSYLVRNTLNDIITEYPNLEESLIKICGTGERIVECLRQKGMDRRAFKRYILQAQVWFQVLATKDSYDKSNLIEAELYDISINGLSFNFHFKDKEYICKLVGKTIGVNLNIKYDRKKTSLPLTGVVQGVQSYPIDEYSVHVKLRQNLSEKAINALIKIADIQLCQDLR
jgi:CRP-like cAMP-binding protein